MPLKEPPFLDMPLFTKIQIKRSTEMKHSLISKTIFLILLAILMGSPLITKLNAAEVLGKRFDPARIKSTEDSYQWLVEMRKRSSPAYKIMGTVREK